ncbi:hypothetical protein COMA1_10308 [Candidatus Nitrospira nitrosa]|uniref:Uncharacterized protein n=1 Tax=Candidatus Nitrospira nitrosa TaxID=1742972 RepID=A0A0S4L9T2_9BACT|nr:hypothetical protein COMA1_10308 [Candidatus Nitrospira nitrosa]
MCTASVRLYTGQNERTPAMSVGLIMVVSIHASRCLKQLSHSIVLGQFCTANGRNGHFLAIPLRIGQGLIEPCFPFLILYHLATADRATTCFPVLRNHRSRLTT